MTVFVFTGVFAVPFYAWRKAEEKASKFNAVMVDEK